MPAKLGSMRRAPCKGPLEPGGACLMNLLSSFRLTTFSSLCAALVGCAGIGEPATPTVSRTPPPQGYEKTIANYLAFKIRGQQKNVVLSFGSPEPGSCPLDGYIASSRGWVVPVVYETRTREPTGKETVHITTRQYFFWFLGDTIAGITPRIELCPGAGTIFLDGAAPSAGTPTLLPAAFAAPARPDAPRSEDVVAPDTLKRGRPQERAKAGVAQKSATPHAAKKGGTSSGKARPAVKKVGSPRAKAKPKLEW